MGLTDIRVVLGQCIDIWEVFPDGYGGDYRDHDYVIGLDGQPLKILEGEFRRMKPLAPGETVNTIFVLDYSPYDGALGDEIVLGVLLHDSGDGYADITHLFELGQEQIERWTNSVIEMLKARGLPCDNVRMWIVATPDI